ncbi:hypothetical protein EVG20_g1202 [Dentipellis fragilis]|uniref:G-protein coupled receptors family 1 profile domain-containing protein n=1 Tax=Dentipellis fragilis TaxID=205917 RepID=A0A4Y9ZEF8_9AGAM|nr:hypothetical protein EVG20_g1202 [Dentipellis fragilis]
MADTLGTASSAVESAPAAFRVLQPGQRWADLTFSVALVGQTLLLLLLATLVLSRKLRARNPTLISLLVIAFVDPIPPALLIYAGEVNNPSPPFGLCFTQAVLRDSLEATFVMATLSLLVELYLRTRVSDVFLGLSQRKWTWIAVVVPYVLYFTLVIISVVLGAKHHEQVTHPQDTFGCLIDVPSFRHAVLILEAVVISLALALFSTLTDPTYLLANANTGSVLNANTAVFVLYNVGRIWNTLRKIGSAGSPDIYLIIRGGGFTLFLLFYILLNALTLTTNTAAAKIVPVIYQSIMPLALFLIFGLTRVKPIRVNLGFFQAAHPPVFRMFYPPGLSGDIRTWRGDRAT